MPTVKTVQQRKCPKSHKGAFGHLKTFLPGRNTHKNNLSVAQTPRTFYQNKNKSGVITKQNKPKAIKVVLPGKRSWQKTEVSFNRKDPFVTEKYQV